ncbi:hypothetical protein SCHPADRAFT_931051 [Schizopora paradoxa]|uniref:F-box domain-containing protein n=1 Tax=Schizopora paradoxa TaxID=27342 RepID=A0A0H2RDM2_9AGAM|nr:hypothetical protein SCHPADRAFT_931051 [Schizopora paradoxa]
MICSTRVFSAMGGENFEGFTLVSRSRSLLQRLESLNNILTGMTSGLDLKIQDAQQQVQRMGAMCGLAVLPSEVVTNMFLFAVHGSPLNTPRALVSMNLSHVCRGFRALVLANPHFWSTINSTPRRPELGLIGACVQRSKDRPLDIHLNLYTSKVQYPTPAGFALQRIHLECDQVLSLLLPHIQRWRSLHLHFVEAEGFSGSTEIFEHVGGALFPMLEKIGEYHHWLEKDGSDRDMKYLSSWNTPALSTLSVYDCLPRTVVSIASITVFHATLFALYDVVESLDLLNKMQSLSELYFDISGYHRFKIEKQDMDRLAVHDRVVLGNVKKFTLCFASHHATDEKEEEFERLYAIFSKLQAPIATHVRLEGRRNAIPRYAKHSLDLHRLLFNLPVNFPKVVDCDMAINGKSDSTSRNTTFPLHFPTGLEVLRFACNTSLSFPEGDAEVVVFDLNHFRELKLHSSPKCNTSAVKDWVRWMVDNAQLHGAWQSFEKLVVNTCTERDHRDGCECEETILRDNVIDWCDKPEYRRFPRNVGDRGDPDGWSD